MWTIMYDGDNHFSHDGKQGQLQKEGAEKPVK